MPSPKRPAAKKDEPKYVTQEAFEGAIGKLVDVVMELKEQVSKPAPATAPVPETPIEKEVRKAGPSNTQINPEWDEKAREIIGDALDHCEMEYLKGGGALFTVVIKNEKSNAPKDYLDRMKSDRRSKEIGHEGVEGVEAWCKLVKSNLSRPTHV